MIKVSLIVLAGLAATVLLRGRSASLRHWVLATALVCAALTPALEQIVPAWHVPVSLPWIQQQGDSSTFGGQDPGHEANLAVSKAQATGSGRQDDRVSRLLALTWAFGAAISLLALAAGFARLRRIASSSCRLSTGAWIDALSDLERTLPRHAKVRLLLCDHASLLVTWGIRRPTVVLPRGARQWPAERIRAVLAHELAHVRRADWAVQMVAELIRSVYWFNPLMWIASRRLRRDSEFACDDAVLASGMEAPEYAAQLLDVARAVRPALRGSLLAGMAMIRPSQFERRVHAMLNANVNRSPLTRSACAGAILALLVLTIPIAGMSAAPPEPNGPVMVPGVTVTMRAVPGDAVLPAAQEPGARPALVSSGAGVARKPEPQAPGSFSGSLVDATGREIPDVPVKITNEVSGLVYTTRTDTSGRFVVNDLSAGAYLVDVSKPGFKRILVRLQIAAGQAARADLVAQLGMLKETIHVSAGSGTGGSARTCSPAQGPGGHASAGSLRRLDGRGMCHAALEACRREADLSAGACDERRIGRGGGRRDARHGRVAEGSQAQGGLRSPVRRCDARSAQTVAVLTGEAQRDPAGLPGDRHGHVHSR